MNNHTTINSYCHNQGNVLFLLDLQGMTQSREELFHYSKNFFFSNKLVLSIWWEFWDFPWWQCVEEGCHSKAQTACPLLPPARAPLPTVCHGNHGTSHNIHFHHIQLPHMGCAHLVGKGEGPRKLVQRSKQREAQALNQVRQGKYGKMCIWHLMMAKYTLKKVISSVE